MRLTVIDQSGWESFILPLILNPHPDLHSLEVARVFVISTGVQFLDLGGSFWHIRMDRWFIENHRSVVDCFDLLDDLTRVQITNAWEGLHLST